MIYNEITQRYFAAAPGAGELAGPWVSRGSAGNRSQGTWVQFDVELDGKEVRAARFLAFGCPHTLAVAAYVGERAVGCVLDIALPESVPDLCLRFAVPVEKLGRLLIIEDAWLLVVRAAIDYRGQSRM